MDDIDLANEHAEMYREQAILAHFGNKIPAAKQQCAGGAASMPRARGGASRVARCCIDCGTAIEPARLRALPGATRCVACQEEMERTCRI